MKKLKFLISLIAVIILLSCKEKVKPAQEDKEGPPLTKIVKVFEIKYGETVSFQLSTDKMTISLVDLQDSVTVNCDLIDLRSPQYLTSYMSRVRIYADVVVAINDNAKRYKLVSRECGAFEYGTTGGEIENVLQMATEIKNTGRTKGGDTFYSTFTKGTKVTGQYEIYMMYAYPRTYYRQGIENITKNDYKFILAIATK